MKTLYVGDPHVKVSNLEESIRLFDYIMTVGSRTDVTQIVLLGDLFDTHSVIRQEVNAFWTKTIAALSSLNKKVIILVGNHDQIHVKEHETSIYSLMAYQGKFDNVTIVNDHFVLGNRIYHAYTHSAEKLIKNCTNAMKMGANILVAHGNFTELLFGDMIEASLIPQTTIISGHVHKSSLSKGKVFYAGSPTWGSATDANEDKGIWVVDDITGEREFLTTKNCVTPMYRITIKEGEDMPEIPTNAKLAFELIGQSTWITALKKKLKGMGSIKAVPVDRKHVKADNSKLLNLDDYANSNFTPLVGVSVNEITGYIRRLDAIQ